MNEKEKLKIALGEPLKKTIGGQEIELYPLEVTYLPDFFSLYGKLGGKSDEDAITNFMADKENSKIMVDLIVAMIKNSFPKDTDEVLIKRFCMKYFVELQEILLELHQPGGTDKRKIKQIKRLREKIAKKPEEKKEDAVQLA